MAALDRLEPARGGTGGGYPLTIYGFGLDEAVEAFVGGRPCPILTQAPTSLSCAVPPGPPAGGPARVELRWEGRLESTRDDHFAYARPSFIERGTELGVVSGQTGSAVSIADIDLDGRPDLALPSLGPFQAGFVETTPTVLLQRGDSFMELPLDVSFRQQSILPADLFGEDGIPELVYSSNVTHTLEVITRTSTLSPYSVLGRLNGARGMLDYAPVPVDLDGDGDLDLVGCLNDLRTDDYVVRVVVNEGDSGLRVAPELVLGFEFTGLQCGVTNVADLDLDGRPEFIFCGDAVVVGALDDEGRIRLAERYILDLGVVPDCRSAVARDLDLDGDVDLALAYKGELLVSDSSDRVEIPSGVRIFSSPRSDTGDLELSEEGLLEAEDSITPTCTSPGSQRSDAALSMGVGAALWLDADLDGDDDLLLPTPSGHCAIGPGLYVNLADRGELGFSYMAIGGPILPDAPGGAIGDLDGDGDLDAVVANGGAGRRAVFLSEARSGRASDNHFVTMAHWDTITRAWSPACLASKPGPSDKDRASPKSDTRTRSSLPTRTFSGLKSRCTRPSRWAAKRPWPASASLPRISLVVRGARFIQSRSVPPSTNSIAMTI